MSIRYYKFFTSLYATSLLFAEEVMTNSSWTHAHITDLLNTGRRSIIAGLLLMDDKTYEVREKQGMEMEKKAGCRVVFPPCDTGSLQGLGNLSDRKRELVSLAQFRWVTLS
jgi:alpha-1,2-mannosyltransferase